MYTYLSPTSTIQSFFGRPPAHIHPPLTFSLRVNLLFSLVHKGCYKCHIVIATMPATPHTAVLQYGLSFVRHRVCSQPKSNVLFQHVTMLATTQRKSIFKLLNYLRVLLTGGRDKPKPPIFRAYKSIYRYPVGIFGWVVGPSQGLYLRRTHTTRPQPTITVLLKLKTVG